MAAEPNLPDLPTATDLGGAILPGQKPAAGQQALLVGWRDNQPPGALRNLDAALHPLGRRRPV